MFNVLSVIYPGLVEPNNYILNIPSGFIRNFLHACKPVDPLRYYKVNVDLGFGSGIFFLDLYRFEYQDLYVLPNSQALREFITRELFYEQRIHIQIELLSRFN